MAQTAEKLTDTTVTKSSDGHRFADCMCRIPGPDLHMLFLDGVYIEDKYGSLRFRQVKAPTSDELSKLTHTIAHRVGRCLERRGLLESDAGNTWLTREAVSSSEEDTAHQLLGSSITYRIAVVPQQGRKVITL